MVPHFFTGSTLYLQVGQPAVILEYVSLKPPLEPCELLSQHTARD